jgi:hypothetical protein
VTPLPVPANSRSRTHCAKGHEYSADNSFIDARGRRYCNVCRIRRPETCQRGHPFDDANTFVTNKGRRECRTCRNEKERDRYRRNAKPKAVTAQSTPRQRTPAPPPPAPVSIRHTLRANRPAVTLPDTTHCQRCGQTAGHNIGTPDAICDACQTRQQRREARQRYARTTRLADVSR